MKIIKSALFLLVSVFSASSFAEADLIKILFDEGKKEFISFKETRERSADIKDSSKFLTNIYNTHLSSRTAINKIQTAIEFSEMEYLERLIVIHKNNLLTDQNYKSFFLSPSFDKNGDLKNSEEKPLKITVNNNGIILSSTVKKTACDTQLSVLKVLVDIEEEARANPNSATITSILGPDFKIDGEFHDGYILDYIKIGKNKFYRPELLKIQYPGVLNFKNLMVSLFTTNASPSLGAVRKAFPLFVDQCDLYSAGTLDKDGFIDIEYSVIRDNKITDKK